tara:strand:+ start:1951 stop:2307 length:357 start_codon:yes stop_codon:yes gene_type:complete
MVPHCDCFYSTLVCTAHGKYLVNFPTKPDGQICDKTPMRLRRSCEITITQTCQGTALLVMARDQWKCPASALNHFIDAALAQLVEHRIRNAGVRGSNPLSGTTQFPISERLCTCFDIA